MIHTYVPVLLSDGYKAGCRCGWLSRGGYPDEDMPRRLHRSHVVHVDACEDCGYGVVTTIVGGRRRCTRCALRLLDNALDDAALARLAKR